MSVIHDIESAAAYCRVAPEVIRQWIRDGLRAAPVHSAKRRDAKHPREWRIREEWLDAYIDRLSQRGEPPAPAEKPAKGRGRAAVPAGDDGLWECPV